MPSGWKAILDLIIAQVISAMKLGGVRAWLAKIVLKYGGQALIDLFNSFLKKIKREGEQEIAKQEKDKIVEKPDATADEVGKAYEDYYNSGRDSNSKP